LLESVEKICVGDEGAKGEGSGIERRRFARWARRRRGGTRAAALAAASCGATTPAAPSWLRTVRF